MYHLLCEWYVLVLLITWLWFIVWLQYAIPMITNIVFGNGFWIYNIDLFGFGFEHIGFEYIYIYIFDWKYGYLWIGFG